MGAERAVRNISSFTKKLPGTLQSVALLAFTLNLILALPTFFPNLTDIGTWDESFYIFQGKMLTKGVLPDLSRSPLSAFLYAGTYLFFKSSPFWLIHACSVGRLIFFSLIWASAYLIAKQLSNFASPLLMIALLLTSPFLLYLLSDGPVALFTAFSGLALWQLLSFRNDKSSRHLWLASTFLGFAALVRTESIILLVIFIAFTLLLSAGEGRGRHVLVVSLLPFTLIVGGYILLYGLATGRFELGTSIRSYDTFEQGQGLAYADEMVGKEFYAEGKVMAQRLYGTGEENNYSVMRAVRRNPKAYLARVFRTIKMAWRHVLKVYGDVSRTLCK